MEALIDGDIACFRCAAASEDADLEICLLRLDKQIQDILYLTDTSTRKIFLTGSDNFRKTIYPEYKANRKDKIPPKWLQQCREYLVTEWNAKVTDGCEADDMLGINQTSDSIICSIDKDLLQIPGKHYNWVKNEWTEQTELEGIRFFYHQLLKGDRADNIAGLDGIGEVKARRYLEGCESEQEMFDTVRELYNDDETMFMYGKCLWIWRSEGDIWQPERFLTIDQSLKSL